MASPTDIIDRFQTLKAARSPYEAEWEDIARLIRPLGKGFGSRSIEGTKRHRNIYDSSPLETLEQFKGGLFGALTPPTTQWLQLEHIDDDLNEYGPVKEYFEIVSKRVWRSFGPSITQFYSNVPSAYANLGAFGTACMYSVEKPGQQRIIDRTRSLAEIYIDTNDEDEIDTVFRYFQLTAKAILQRKEWSPSPKVQAAAADPKRAGEKFWIIHAVYPDGGLDLDMKWAECYVLEEEKHTLGEAAYFEFPYFVPRWDIAEGERYGRGPGHVALADVKSLNLARKANLSMLDYAARPPLLAADESDLGTGTTPYPGETVFGAINKEGKALIQPLFSGKNANVAIEMEGLIRDAIKDAFKYGLMQVVGSYDMTATEFSGRDENRQQLMGPYRGNVETGLLSPYTKRRVGILDRAGQLPQMPEELARAAGGIQVRYIGLAARLQKLKEGEATIKGVQALGVAAQLAPDVITRIDPDDLAEAIADGFGISSMLRSREIAKGIREKAEQQMNMQKMAELAPGVAKGVKDVTDAQVTARDAGMAPPQAPNAVGAQPAAAPVPIAA